MAIAIKDTTEFKLQLPSDILLTLNQSKQELERNIKQSLAISLYKQEKITIGKAAQLAGTSRYEFEILLADAGVPISLLSADDVFNDEQKLQ